MKGVKVYMSDELVKKLFPDGTSKTLLEVLDTVKSPEFKAIASSLGLADKDWAIVFKLAVCNWQNKGPASHPTVPPNGLDIDIDIFS